MVREQLLHRRWKKVNSPVNQHLLPTKTNHTFDGWFNGETKFQFATTPIESDITLKAKWTIIDENLVTYVVTFDSNGGSDVGSITVGENEKITAPTQPTKLNNVFFRLVSWRRLI